MMQRSFCLFQLDISNDFFHLKTRAAPISFVRRNYHDNQDTLQMLQKRFRYIFVEILVHIIRKFSVMWDRLDVCYF